MSCGSQGSPASPRTSSLGHGQLGWDFGLDEGGRESVCVRECEGGEGGKRSAIRLCIFPVNIPICSGKEQERAVHYSTRLD